MFLPQIIYVSLCLLGLGIALGQHGKPKTGKYNSWYSLISFTIHIYLLYVGGFSKGIL